MIWGRLPERREEPVGPPERLSVGPRNRDAAAHAAGAARSGNGLLGNRTRCSCRRLPGSAEAGAENVGLRSRRLVWKAWVKSAGHSRNRLFAIRLAHSTRVEQSTIEVVRE